MHGPKLRLLQLKCIKKCSIGSLCMLRVSKFIVGVLHPVQQSGFILGQVLNTATYWGRTPQRGASQWLDAKLANHQATVDLLRVMEEEGEGTTVQQLTLREVLLALFSNSEDEDFDGFLPDEIEWNLLCKTGQRHFVTEICNVKFGLHWKSLKNFKNFFALKKFVA